MLIDLFTVFREEADASGIVFYYSGILSQNVITTMSDSLKQKTATAGRKRRQIPQGILHFYRNDTKCDALLARYA